ncbi:MAG: hypothetical protein EBU90_12845 [Proteobacteria bacterium]|nr:hypothetical protein [Pseudomonadota bacterium]NBP15395.1 hypothetical protein [bacterium]
MKLHNYFGNYLGIVVQNNDPLKRGRVKVYVPHISPSVYKGWDEVKKDKKFKFLGVNTNSDLTNIIDDLKKILPWAECASPLVGENTFGRFNASLIAGSISDSNKKDTFVSNLTSNNVDQNSLTPYSMNYDNIGEKSGHVYDIDYYKLKDAFSDPSKNNINNVNKFAYNYIPETYSNSAKGSFSIPSVGSHLWVFFANGDPMKPVYFATSFGAEEWNSIYSTGSAGNITNNDPRVDQGIDYPGTFENIKSKDQKPSADVETYRNKFVINQKGGTVSFINTDNKEVLKLTHYSGSFKEFNNFANIELATKNDQKLVLEDSFLTIRGDRNEFIERDYDLNTIGNFYKKIGKLDTTLVKEWKDIVQELANAKQLFDIQRADKSKNSSLNYSSSKQRKVGTPAKCPVCIGSKNTYFVYNISYRDSFENIIKPSFSDSGGDYAYGMTIEQGNLVKSLLYPGVAGTFFSTLPSTFLGNSVDGSAFSSTPSQFLGTEPCPACGGTGVSSSSQDGSWVPSEKEMLIKKFLETNVEKLADIEKQLGLGGSEIIEIDKHKIETIGTVMNDFGSIRVDDKGKMNISDVRIAKYGTYYNRTPTPVIEYVNVTDLPGGNYSLNVCNRYNVLVGAGGINMKSAGLINISGTITNIAGSQVNIGSENEVNIDGGKRLSIIADIVSIRQRNLKQVVVDSNLGITKNLVAAGGGYFEGELYVQHITAPAEIQQTNPTFNYGAAIPTTIIGFGVPVSNFAVRSGNKYIPQQGSITGPPHMGFMDPNVLGARTDYGQVAGKIKAGTIIGYVPNPTGPGYLPCTASNTGNPGASPANDVDVYGSNIDCVKGALGGVNSIKGSNQGFGGADASTMPIVVYGTGRDPDSIFMPEHTHMFKNIPLNLLNTNAEVRESAQSLQDGVAAKEGPIENSSK